MRNQVSEPENLDKRDNGKTKTVIGEWWMNIHIYIYILQRLQRQSKNVD